MEDKSLVEYIEEYFYFFTRLTPDFFKDKGQVHLPLIKIGEAYINKNIRFDAYLKNNKESLGRLGGAYAYYRYCLSWYEVKTSLGELSTEGDKEILQGAKEILEEEISLNNSYLKDDLFMFKTI